MTHGWIGSWLCGKGCVLDAVPSSRDAIFSFTLGHTPPCLKNSISPFLPSYVQSFKVLQSER